MRPQVEPVRDKLEWQRKIRSTSSWYLNSFPLADRQSKNETVWPEPSGECRERAETRVAGRNALSFGPVDSRLSSLTSTSDFITQPLVHLHK